MGSIWTSTARLPRFAPLRRDLKTDVLVVGGGIAGLLCAYLLKAAGADCALVEADRICGGTTMNTTAKVTAQHGLIYGKLLQEKGAETAEQYLRANLLAVEEYRRLGSKIACEMEEKNACVYSVSDRSELEWELTALDRLGFPAKFVDYPALPFRTEGAVCFPHQLQFHPLRFAGGLAASLNIYENSGVRRMTEHLAITEKGSVTADKIIVATHFPFINTRGVYFMKLYQERACVTAWRQAPDVDGMYIDAAPDGLSLRNYKNFLLIGGGSHRTGKTVRRTSPHRSSGVPEEYSRESAFAREFFRSRTADWGLRKLKTEAARCFPTAEFAGAWAAQDCMSLDGIPYIGPYSPSTPELFVAAGYNKWGMTGSMVSAMLLSDLVQEKENMFSGLFSPKRRNLTPQLAVNLLEAIKGIAKPTLRGRCSHMGCVLKWNPEEKTWECPCHGSRFGPNGAVLDNPAGKPLRKIP